MALFAPQIKSVQNAFVNGGNIIVNFSVSEHSDVATAVNYKIIDPRKSSVDGLNILAERSVTKTCSPKNSYTITISSNGLNLIPNKYYQIQIQLKNSSTVSAWSQVSLIRPIYQPSFPSNMATSIVPIYPLLYKSEIIYTNGLGEEEILSSCSFTANNITVNGKVDGLKFELPMEKFLSNQSSVYGTLTCTTINGYQLTKIMTIAKNAINSGSITISTLENDYYNGAVKITYSPASSSQIIARTTDMGSRPTWIVVGTLSNGATSWTDYSVEGGAQYKYCILNNSTSSIGTVSNSTVFTNFEDMYLAGNEAMIAIKYNPTISNVKYVTQEAITNTLGGKYPLIRKNGDTKYKTFTISGALYIDCDCIEELSSSNESEIINIEYNPDGELITNASHIWPLNNSSLYLKDIQSLDLNEYVEEPYKIKAREKKLRQYAEDFLTDGQPKLFKSYEEGPYIVHLSNISFTPNKQLGSHIYDFSATATQFCDFNYENLVKFGLDTGNYQNFVIDLTQGG